MAQIHMQAGQAFQLYRLQQQDKPVLSTALFKSQDLQVFQLFLRSGSAVPAHQVPGEVTIHCLEGVLDVVLDTRVEQLAQGQMILLSRNQRHAVSAVTDANALVTLALR